MIGTIFGPYQILSKLGEGGMGEVYRATDSRLKREVALKVLPADVARSADRLARFQREAELLASLNHPHIAHVYGLEESGGTIALVMELVEGEDLSQRIARGPVPIGEALAIAAQIAVALEAAHDRGIIHRDLKPANVKVTGDDVVKVLDFGLAKALGPDGPEASGSVSDSPTLTAQTRLGMILGTAAYMAPEQARGKAVDKRADIWAFGVVLFEMLTGRRLFKGDETSDVLAAVLRQDIDLKMLPPDTPARLRQLLERCLDRDQKTRLRDIGEARVDLARLERGSMDELASATGSAARSGHSSQREMLAWCAAAIAVVTALAIWLTRPAPASTSATGPLTRLTFLPPDNVVAEAGRATISPNGQMLLFSGRGADGRLVLWLRRLDAPEATPLPDTDDAIEPFWSPDSKSIAFGAQGKLKRLDLGATRARPLADAPRSNNGSWSPSGTIVYSPDYGSPLFRVPATGGERQQATAIGLANRPDNRYPVFLPDGRHFLYSQSAKLMVGQLDSAEGNELLPDSGPAIYAPPGWLIYVRNGVLLAHAFDADRLVLSGEPIPLAAAPQGLGWAQGARASVSQNGVLVIQDATQYDYQLGWYDRSGKQLSVLGPLQKANAAEEPRLSPDGTRVVVQIRDQNQDLWIGSVARGTLDRFTATPVLEQLPIWSLDNRSIICNTARNKINGVYRIPVSGGDDTLLAKGTVFPGDLSPDGKWLFFQQTGETTRMDIWVQPASDDASTTPSRAHAVIHSEADERQPRVSSDSRWIAYASDFPGTHEVYVRRLESDGSVGDPIRVSNGGGVEPTWSHDGRELFYVNASQGYLSAQLMAVAVKNSSATTFEFEPPKPLFKVRMLPNQSIIADYDVSHDGQRFLIGVAMSDGRATPATVLLNWTNALKR